LLQLFTVQLVLGEQCCEVTANTIKKAQHMAAEEILAKTTLSKPVPRHSKPTPSSNSITSSPGSVTPTVMLNGLAMQLGLQVSYHQSPSTAINQLNNKSMRANLPRYLSFDVSLHCVMFFLKNPLCLCDDDDFLFIIIPLFIQILQESGPPHMKAYKVLINVGDLSEEGEGKSKKLARAHAASKLMLKIQSLPQLPQQNQIRASKSKKKKKKGQTTKMNAENNQNLNPISRLVQIQQGKKEQEPEYTMLLERSLPLNRHEFVMQAKVGKEAATGSGLLKKVAKRNAAEAMLVKLGYKEYSHVQFGQLIFIILAHFSPGQKGLLHLSPCTYQQMEEARGAGPHVKSHDLPGSDPTWCGPGPLIPQCQGGGTAALARYMLV
uniref:Staufen double-stranded RNA binding protein 2 n=1 Tax=Eptatretus burgeri TaxID=7764 RepID=A0A8C4Q5H6_EPTBU